MSEYKLTSEIVKLSQSQVWDIAKLEWDLIGIRKEEEAEECLCGHYPIKEVCLLKNLKNGESTEVGNCCVKKFDKGFEKVFASVKKIIKKSDASLNSETLDLAFRKRYINDWEMKFYIDVMRKRKLSFRQKEIKEKINQKVLKLLNS